MGHAQPADQRSGNGLGAGACLVVQHAEPETAGLLGSALERHGVELDVRCVFAGAALPDDLSGHRGLLIMGGTMSAYLDDGFPTRRHELKLLGQAVAGGVPTLGVCLGAQLLAVAGGGEVRRGAAGPEIGWGRVALTEAAIDDPLLAGLPGTFPVLHWHGDTFDPGPAGTILASNDRYMAQALRVGEVAWGLQFHLEVDEPQVAAFVSAFAEDAGRAEGGAAGIVSGSARALAELGPAARLVATRFAEMVATRAHPPRLGVPDVL